MATKTTFNKNKCTLDEMNRELKRLASRKCRAKTEDEKQEATRMYQDLVEVKNKRFATTRKSYITFSDAEISKLDLETTVKAIKSLQSVRCVYKSRKDEILEVENKYQMHKQELIEKAKYDEFKKKFE